MLRDRSRRFERAFEGEPTLLVRDGQRLPEALRREGVDEDELMRALREHGFCGPGWGSDGGARGGRQHQRGPDRRWRDANDVAPSPAPPTEPAASRLRGGRLGSPRPTSAPRSRVALARSGLGPARLLPRLEPRQVLDDVAVDEEVAPAEDGLAAHDVRWDAAQGGQESLARLGDPGTPMSVALRPVHLCRWASLKASKSPIEASVGQGSPSSARTT